MVGGAFDWIDKEYLLLGLLALAALVALERVLGRGPGAPRLPSWRRWGARIARVILVLCLTFALAGFVVVSRDDSRSVLFVLDRSASMERAKQEWALDWIRDAMRTLGDEDRAGVVVFGTEANLEMPLRPRPELLAPRALVERDFTNPEAALRLAFAHFPAGTRRSLVLLSDGNENLGDALAEAAVARSQGVAIHTVYCETAPPEGEALIEQVLAPERVERGEPFSLRIAALSGKKQGARLRVQRGAELIENRAITLEPGRNVIELAQELDEADVHVFKVSIDADEDDNPLNNVAWALTEASGRSRVLLIDRQPKAMERFKAVLEAEGYRVDLGSPSALPVSAEELARYDVVLISDTPATAWSAQQMAMLERFVVDMGGGLAMLGGEESFGLGGYFKTPIERALPVDCDLRNKEDLPSIGLVFVIDRSGSMRAPVGGQTRLDLAKEGVRRTLKLLYPSDKVGVLGFDHDVEWPIPLGRMPPGPRIEEALSRMDPGGGTFIAPALEAAMEALAQSDVDLKHIVLLTDGRSEPGEYESSLGIGQRAKVTLSTVGIGEASDEELLEWLARRGGGRCFIAKDASELPRIFTKDAMTATRSLMVERSFRPVVVGGAELLRGLPAEPFPPLSGFVLTTPKDDAEVVMSTTKGREGKEDGPILVRWRKGLGKAAAWTSSFKEPWARKWLAGWEGTDALWLRLVSWLRKDRTDRGTAVSVSWDRGEGLIEVSLDEESARSGAFRDLRARISGPPGAAEVPPLALTQVGPARYEGRFEARRTGVYFASIGEVQASGERLRARKGFVLPYPREYRSLRSDPSFLARLSARTGGLALSLEDSPPPGLFDAAGPAPVSSEETWPYLMALAAMVLILDVALRRWDIGHLFRRRLRAEDAARVQDDARLFRRLMDRKKELKRRSRRSGGASEARLAQEAAALESAVAPPEVSPRSPTDIVEAVTVAEPEITKEPAPVKTPPPKTPPPKKRPRPIPPVDDGDMTSRLLAAKRRARRDQDERSGRA